jgi:hypothetical protein
MSSALNCGSLERLIIGFLLSFYKTAARVLLITKGMAKKAPEILHELVSACSHRRSEFWLPCDPAPVRFHPVQDGVWDRGDPVDLAAP